MKRSCSFYLIAIVIFVAQSEAFAQYFQGRPVQQQPYKTYSQQPFAQQNNIQQHWTQKIATSGRSHEFGVVPSYSKQEHTFEFQNNFEYPIQLVGVRASCGCTKPSILTKVVKPGGSGKVIAKYDTKNFKGNKKATISVTVRRDQPYTEFGEIQFKVNGTIRRDVVLNPGTVAFKNVTLGENAKRTIQILYAGNPNWQIENVTSSNPNISITKKELQRNATKRRVDYELLLELNGEQSVGSFMDQILITTNDRKNKSLAVNVHGNVRSVVQVSPVKLGLVTKGEEIEKRLIVRGIRPFAIKRVQVGDERIQIAPSEGSKTLHILTYKLDTTSIGQLVSNITIETDDPDQTATTVGFEAQIVPGTFALDDNLPEE